MSVPLRPLTPLLALAVAVTLAACGGSDKDTTQTGMTVVTVAPTTTPRQAQPAPANATDEQVIRLWADTLRSGDVDGAAAMFAVPSVVQLYPDEPPIALDTLAEVRAFNAALPCGAELMRTERRKGMTVGLFRLSHRPGATCDGPGGTARAGFVIRDGRILHWLRLPDVPGDQNAQPAPPADQAPPLV